MPSSQEAAAEDLVGAAMAFSLGDNPKGWQLGEVVTPQPLATVEWDAEKSQFVSAHCRRDEFVAQSMVLLALRRLTLGWGRQRASQELVVYEGKGQRSNLRNLWAASIAAAKRPGGRLADAPKHLAHFDNYDAFSKFYAGSWQISDTCWQRNTRFAKGFLHFVAEEACVQWALTQPQEDIETAGALLQELREVPYAEFLTERDLPGIDRQTAPLRDRLLAASDSMQAVKELTLALHVDSVSAQTRFESFLLPEVTSTAVPYADPPDVLSLPAELGARQLFHSNLFIKVPCNAFDSALGNNSQGLQWVTHWSEFDYLPTGASPDPQLLQAWEQRDEDQFFRRAKALYRGPTSADSVATGQRNQWLRMQKGDIVMAHKEGQFVMGMLESNAWDAGAMLWSTLGALGVNHPDEVKNTERRAFRRITWLRAGDMSALDAATKEYNGGFFQGTCSRAKAERAPAIYAAYLRAATRSLDGAAVPPPQPVQPVPAPADPSPPVHATDLGRSNAPTAAASEAGEGIPFTVIGEFLEQHQTTHASTAPQVAEGQVTVSTESAHVTVEVHEPCVAANLVKLDPEAENVQQGVYPSVPVALSLPVVVAQGSLQASGRRRRLEVDDTATQDDNHGSRRPRRVLPVTWKVGDRISYVFNHDGIDTPFYGMINEVHADRRVTCDFDDGSCHRVEMAKLQRSPM